MDSSSLVPGLKSTLAFATLAFALGGCAVRARPVAYGYGSVQPVYAEPAPVATYDDYVYEDSPGNVEAYPYVVYEGTPTYYVQGRWYRRTPRGWAYYRSEPQPLYGQRPYVPQPTAAYGHYGAYGNGGYVNTAPPVYVNTAPPARRYTNTAPPAHRRR
jgi:hypothetical protein